MKYFFFSIFFLIFVSFIFVYINISSNNDIYISENKKNINNIVKNESILEKLSILKKKNRLPAKELYLRVNLNYRPKIKILYQAIIEKLSKYSLFGIEQILMLNNINYSILKTKNNLKLFINFDRKSQAQKIINIFNSYNFNIKLKRIKIEQKD